MIRLLVAAVVAVAGLACGCGPDRSKPAGTTPTTAPSTQPSPPASRPVTAPAAQQADIVFQHKSGIRLQYPGDWKAQPSSDYVLVLAPAAEASAKQRIRLDVPDLPPHFPGMIKLGLVQNGYIDDLRKGHPDLKIEESTDRDVSGASARLVRSSFGQNGQRYEDVALMMIHADRVYILSMISDADRASATRQVFDRIAASVRWTK